VPVILEGKDVVLAAETGSGKTLAYLAPLIHLALRSNQAEAAVAAEKTEADGPEAQGTWQRQRQWRPHPTAALVLCPNAALCEQVVAAAHALKDPESGAPLAAVAFVSAQSPPPVRLPDIVVSTPGGLLSLLDSGGPAYGYEWTRAGGCCCSPGCMPMPVAVPLLLRCACDALDALVSLVSQLAALLLPCSHLHVCLAARLPPSNPSPYPLRSGLLGAPGRV
jgi:hypothetical protein